MHVPNRAPAAATGVSGSTPQAYFFANLPDAHKRNVKHARAIALSSRDKNSEQVGCSTIATASIGRGNGPISESASSAPTPYGWSKLVGIAMFVLDENDLRRSRLPAHLKAARLPLNFP
jgi:hypothetical protein